MNDSKIEDERNIALNQIDTLEQNVSIEKSEDDFLEELPEKSFESAEHETEQEPEEEEEEEIGNFVIG